MSGYTGILGNHRNRDAFAHFFADMGRKPVGHSMVLGQEGVGFIELLTALADIASFSQDKDQLLSESWKVLDDLGSVVMHFGSDLTANRACVRFGMGFDKNLN